ncbi:uncharacterized protein LOC34619819 [Cyclospora cayetanensis]|uniref:Uncharacterized protein LOC34619819 n=1 Tax=Cyclospora cayetanensis TaxID=88456 RepID=A0A6P6S1T4_9EIME|nr:uncharacterized protein LOC34619819 [Cyclospora cayetanensis]
MSSSDPGANSEISTPWASRGAAGTLFHSGHNSNSCISDGRNDSTYSTRKAPTKLRGASCLLGGVLLHIALGTVYTFGVSSVYLISFLKNRTDPTLRISASATLMAAEFSAMAIGMPLGGALERKVSLLGGFVFVSGVYASKFTIAYGFLPFLLSYGVLYGFGLGVAYTNPLVAALRWFPDQQGLVSGLITAGFGLGSVLFAPLQQQLLNPTGIPPAWMPYQEAPQELYYDDELILKRVPSLFPRIAFVYAALVAAAASLICNPPDTHEKEEKKQQHQQQHPRRHTLAILQPESEQQLPLAAVLKSQPFRLLWTLFLLQGFSILFVASFWKALAATSGAPAAASQQLTETQLAVVGATASAFNAMGRILWGKYADVKTPQEALCLLAGIWSGALLLLSRAADVHPLLYVVAVCLNFFCLGGNFALFPAATATLFGQQAVGRVYGFVFMAQLGSSLMGAIVLPALIQHLGTPAACRVVSVCCFTVTAVLLATMRTRAWEPFKPQ